MEVKLRGGLKGSLERSKDDCIRITSESGALEASLTLTREDLFRLLYCMEHKELSQLLQDLNQHKDKVSETEESLEELENEIEEIEETLREKREEKKEKENDKENLTNEIDDLESEFKDFIIPLKTYYFRGHFTKEDGISSPEDLEAEAND